MADCGLFVHLSRSDGTSGRSNKFFHVADMSRRSLGEGGSASALVECGRECRKSERGGVRLQSAECSKHEGNLLDVGY